MTTLKEFGFDKMCKEFSLQRAERRVLIMREEEFKEKEIGQQTYLYGEFL